MYKFRNCNICFLIFVYVFLLHGCSSDPADNDIQALNEPEDSQPIEEEFMEEEEPTCNIPPGSSRTFTLTGHVPFIHATDLASNLEVKYDLAVNSWAENGLEVIIEYSRIYSETGNIWTVQQNVATTTELRPRYLPLKVGGGGTVGNDTMGNGDILVETGKPQEYMEWGNIPFSEVYEKFKIGEKTDSSLLGTRLYAFYQFYLTFTVYVPEVDQLEVIDKNSRYDQTNLVFWPRRVIYNNGIETKERELPKDRHNITVVLSLTRKPGGGYYDIPVKCPQEGFELTCE